MYISSYFVQLISRWAYPVMSLLQYIPRNMHTVFALLCFVVVIYWLIYPYPSGLLHWHCGNLTIAPVPAKQPWWIWINTSCEFIMNDCIATTRQSTTKPCAYFLGLTVGSTESHWRWGNITSGNGVVPSVNKPLSEPILTNEVARVFFIAFRILWSDVIDWNHVLFE